MQRRAVVVVPLSQSELKLSAPCWSCLAPETALPFCKKCQALQPLPGNPPTYFELFEIPETLVFSNEELQTKFHALSKLFHPDRFAQSQTREVDFSMRWSTLLNRAYRTLKDPTERAKYILAIHGIEMDKNAKMPLDLAETYFDLQDALTEGGSNDDLEDFKKTLSLEKEKTEKQWQTLSALSAPLSQEHFKTLSELLIRRRFLESMEADLLKRVAQP